MWWPAAVVSDRSSAIERVGGAAAERLRRLPDAARVFQYFGSRGEFELEKSMTQFASWEEGIEKRYHEKSVSAKRAKAIENARAFVERGDLTAENDAGVLWWSQKPPPLPVKDDEEGGAKRAKRRREEEREVGVETNGASTVEDVKGFTFPVVSKEFAFLAERKEYAPPLSVLALGKPAPFELVRRSVFVSVPPPRRGHKEDSATCECRPPPQASEAGMRLGCGAECLNRKLRFSCDSRTCPCGDACSNRPLSSLPVPKTKVTRTENRGWGLVLLEPVKAGTFITEYAGEIVNEAECARRLEHDKMTGEENFYLMEISSNYVIDAKFKGSIARFINSGCHPNCETQRWVDAATNETRVGIFAREDIPAGTELTYDYNFAHFGDANSTSFMCMCGHPKCRGTLDAAKTSIPHLHRKLRVQAMMPSNKDNLKSKKKQRMVKGEVVDYDATKNRYKIGVDAAEGDARVFVWVQLDGEKAAKHAWIGKAK